MNSAEIKLGDEVIVSMPIGSHSHKQGDKGLVVGVPIALVKFADGHLERFYCHEIERVEPK